MAHAPDDHNKADAYHHFAGKEKRAHEGSQSAPPGKADNAAGFVAHQNDDDTAY